ncbi:MAG: hypothetical protein JSS49_06775 [Planctomycetes bacterium]|nr:hypothetical protein [Planctomycetota bacterium]
MSTPAERRSPFLRLLDAFLQEENIKWMLGLGVCILLGSSLRLVTLHWQEYTPVWKYLILLTYSGTVFALGEFSFHRLGLRKTGTVLMALTVLLIPICFLALHWVQPRTDSTAIDGLRNTGLMVLLGVNLLWSAFAAQRIFAHFLRGSQPTFLISYLILCLAGAIVPGLPPAWSPVLTLGVWAVFAVGTVKVNRHVFWLTEEQRLPRIFGFFPILLLGGLFAAVFTLGLAHDLTAPRLGLLSTLMALPILLTADAVARVFEQRTGGLVRPLPWSISGPLALGMLLSVSGVVMGLTGWPGSGLIVPTAAIAAVAMGVIAHRTGKSAFVWGMVFCIVVVYQTSPVFFKELLLQLRDQAAAAVRQQRLPYAFYGLTYAPLIVVFSLVSASLNRRGQTLFAKPLQVTATILPCVLLAVSFTHSTAVLPVSVILFPLFASQMVLHRNHNYLIPAAVAFLSGTWGAPQFARIVLEWDVSLESELLTWVAASALLLVPGAVIDRWSNRFRSASDVAAFELRHGCQMFSRVSTLLAAVAWFVQFELPDFASGSDPGTTAGVVIAVLMMIQTLWWLKPGLGEAAIGFAVYLVQSRCLPVDFTRLDSVEPLAGLLLGVWCLSRLLQLTKSSRVARAFGPASLHISFAGLTMLFGLFTFDWAAQHAGLGRLSPLVSALMMAWGLDAGRRLKRPWVASIAWSALFVYVTATLCQWLTPVVAREWWMFAWAATGLALLGLRQRLSRTVESPPTNWLSPLSLILPVVFVVIGTVSLLFLDWPYRLAGLMALCGLIVARKLRLPIDLSEISPMLLNWQFLVACLAGFAGRSGTLLDLTTANVIGVSLPLATCAAFSLWCFESRRVRHWTTSVELVLTHQLLLLILVQCALCGALTSFPAGTWTVGHIGWAVATWFGIVAACWANAVRTQCRDLAWWGIVACLGSLVYFIIAGVLDPMVAGIEYVVIIAGVTAWVAGRGLQSSPSRAILSTPLQQLGFWLPMLILPLAIWRELGDPHTTWVGANSFPLLGAAAFYFWRGVERRQLGTTLLSLVMVNVACLFLWKDLNWSDPQLFLMPVGISILVLTELMHREIPAAYHDRLRFVGSLTILTSPVFHIVTGSWLHILTLMVASVLLALAAIGLRIRTLLYTSTGFLLADLVALVARGSVDEPNVLWIAGVALGAAIIGLGAVCENHRELLLARLRYLASELEQWA